jgi:hypothetical protein
MIYALLSPFPDWLGLTILSLVLGALMMVMYHRIANHDAITRAKDAIRAGMLELKLFRDYPRVTISAQFKLLGSLARFQWHMLVVVLIMSLPMTLVLAQMGLRYQWRSLRLDEEILLRVRVDSDQLDLLDAGIEPNDALTVSAGPVAGEDDVVWRIRAKKHGTHLLNIQVGGNWIEKEFVVGDGPSRVSAMRPGRDWIDQLLHPVEARVPDAALVTSIELEYPGVDSWVTGRDYWILYFFVVSMLGAIVQKPLFAAARSITQRTPAWQHQSQVLSS